MLIQGPAHGSIMLLGMVDTKQIDPQTNGQEYRDSTRINALAGHGYFVLTVDDKHCDKYLANHLNTNFCDSRRLKRKMESKWGPLHYLSLGHICLDYFWSPVSI